MNRELRESISFRDGRNRDKVGSWHASHNGPTKWSSQMVGKEAKKILTVILSAILLSAPCQIVSLYGYQAAGSSGAGESSGGTEGASMSTNELQSLVAPIALYPDSLVAQILTASTFPDQVAIANYWLEQNKNLTGSALMQAVDKQSWDPSVKALTEFASVLDNMAKNLTWTSSLGEAYHNQQSEVMTAIQTLRAQAKSKGNLKSSSQITVVQQSPQTIVIQPANPQIVYVPQYNPAVVYGTPYVVPGYVAPAYSAGDVAAAGIIGFGAGIAVGAMMSGGCCSWGFSSWNCGWHGTAVVYHGGGYYGNAGWHGGYYNGGYHSSYGYNNSFNRNFNNNYNRNTNINRNVNNNFNRSNFNNDSWAHSNSGRTTIVGNQAPSAAGVEVILATAGHPEQTAVEGGEACVRAVSAVADSAVADGVVAGSAVFGAKTGRNREASDQVWRDLCCA